MDLFERLDELEKDGRFLEATDALRDSFARGEVQPGMLDDLCFYEAFMGRPDKIIEAIALYGAGASEDNYESLCKRFIDALWNVPLLDQIQRFKTAYQQSFGPYDFIYKRLERMFDFVDEIPGRFLRGDFTGAVASLSWVPMVPSSDDELCLKLRKEGVRLVASGEAGRAADAIREALQLCPADPFIKLELAWAVGKSGNLQAALASTEEVLLAYPAHLWAHRQKIRLIRKMNGVWQALNYAAEMQEYVPWFEAVPVVAPIVYVPTLQIRRTFKCLTTWKDSRKILETLGESATDKMIALLPKPIADLSECQNAG